MSSRTTLTIPENLRDEAKALDINISEICRYALETAIPGARSAQVAGNGFKPVTFRMLVSDYEEVEVVQFTGKLIGDDYPIKWYVTPNGRVVEMYEDGPVFSQDGDILVFDSIEDFRSYVTEHGDHDGIRHRVLQAAEAELGRTPTPRSLDW